MEHWKNKSLEDLTEVRDGVLYKERWVSVKGFEFYYKVSDFGRVKSLRDRWKNYREKILSQNKMKIGYCQIFFHVNAVDTPILVHRLVAEHFCDNSNNMPLVNHKNSNKSDNRYGNLEWTDKRGNALHAIENGLQNDMKGENSVTAKLKNEDVLKIRELASEKRLTYNEIANMFCICKNNVSAIVNRRRWKHI